MYSHRNLYNFYTKMKIASFLKSAQFGVFFKVNAEKGLHLFQNCTFWCRLKKRCNHEIRFSLMLESLRMIAFFQKCNTSKICMTGSHMMNDFLHSHSSIRPVPMLILVMWFFTNNFKWTVSLEVIFLLKCSNHAVQNICNTASCKTLIMTWQQMKLYYGQDLL